jgi:EAL domain-containing protein (putative c-di-GMP-specific phosphodiesterase class I)
VPFRIENTELILDISIGISIHPSDGSSEEDLVSNSERALVFAKAKEEKHHFFDAKLNSELLENLKLEKELGEAIRNRQFILHYQPQVNYEGAICGIEALVRWESPERGLVYPGQFISIAEKIGMINPIGRIILTEVCRQMRLIEDIIPQGFRAAINLSPYQFMQADLIDTMTEIIKNSGIDPSLLEVEITESGIMHNEGESIKKLCSLHEMGITVSIDDFGTGYSSMSKLRDYPIDILKIDRAFITRVPEDKKFVTIARAIIDLAHNLDFKVVAEGIETDEQLEFLNLNRCDFFQGFLFSRPVPFEELKQLLMKGGKIKPLAGK